MVKLLKNLGPEMRYRKVCKNLYWTKRAKSKLRQRVRRQSKLKRRRIHNLHYNSLRTRARKKGTSRKLFNAPLSANVKHFQSRAEQLGLKDLAVQKGNAVFFVPEFFSLCENPTESYRFILSLFKTLLKDSATVVVIDYKNCIKIDLDAQVMMDVVLKEFIDHRKIARQYGHIAKIKSILAMNYEKDHIMKILFSIGSFRIFKNIEVSFPDIIPYHLCIGYKNLSGSEREKSSQKEVHTTQLVDYVLKCLEKMNRQLTPDKLSDLCQVVGEVLINAEEHGTTHHRYSIGFFEDKMDNGQHYGIFNLVIFNFGQTIYEKFKDPSCPTRHIVARMMELSNQYTRKGYFMPAAFEEETLWTLYSLQEGVTSKANYQKRGNGSIRFIESFFNFKGFGLFTDDVSKLVILSGNAQIIFDGNYRFTEKQVKDDKYKVVSFNNSGTFDEKPDKKYVKFAENYFPGTMIIAKIKIGEDDLL